MNGLPLSSSMILEPQDLRATFSERARWTSDLIGRGFTSHLGILEETITDINLIEIDSRHPDFIATKKFSRKQEGASSGADWLWCFGEPGSWFCLLIQAKIINPKTGVCRYLNYKAGEQRAKLQRYARRNKCLPRFCIYTFIPPGSHPPLKAEPRFSNIDSVQWACSILAPKIVQRLVSKEQKRAWEVLAKAIPWNQLFDAGEPAKDRRLGPYVANAIREAERHAEVDTMVRVQTRATARRRKRRRASEVDPRDLIQEDLPLVARRLLRGTLKPIDSPIAGVSVVSSAPIQPILEEERALPEAGQREPRGTPRTLPAAEREHVLTMPDNLHAVDPKYPSILSDDSRFGAMRKRRTEE